MSSSRSTPLSHGLHIQRFSAGPLGNPGWLKLHSRHQYEFRTRTESLERGFYERSGPSERGNGRTVFCIVRKSPGLHPAISQTGCERETLLLSSEAGSAIVAPDDSRASERSADRWPLRAESEDTALEVGGN